MKVAEIYLRKLNENKSNKKKQKRTKNVASG